jgi:hypothetical protein
VTSPELLIGGESPPRPEPGLRVLSIGAMFAKHKLIQGGAQARAVVVSARRTGGAPVDGGYSPVQYHLGLRVHYEDGFTRDVACRVGSLLKGTDLAFFEGDTVPVRYDPDDRSEVAIDVPALEATRTANVDQLKQRAIQRAEGQLAEEVRATPGAAGNTREYVKAELERARRFNTPVGIRVSQKLQDAWAAGRIQVEGGDELAMRTAFDDLKAEIRRDVTEQLSQSPPPR